MAGLGKELGRGEYGVVREVLGQPSVVAKVLKAKMLTTETEDQDEDSLKLECEAMRAMGPDFMPSCLDVRRTDAGAVLLMTRLDGPQLTCHDFRSETVQQRLLDIALHASRVGVMVADSHPGNYMWHKGQVFRVDALALPGVPEYGLETPSRALFDANHYFIDCPDKSTPLLDEYQRAYAFEFGTGATRRLPWMDPTPDPSVLASVRADMRPTKRRLHRPRVEQTGGGESESESDGDLLKTSEIVSEIVEAVTWTSELFEALLRTVIGLSLARYLVNQSEAPFGLDKHGHLVCRQVTKADVMKPTIEIWLENSDFELELPGQLQAQLGLFSFVVCLAFGNTQKQAESLAGAGLERSEAKRTMPDLALLQRWLDLGEVPKRKLRHFNAALKKLGLSKKSVGTMYESLMQYLV
jgi:hypothetical protein